jgi:hypothetical protein
VRHTEVVARADPHKTCARRAAGESGGVRGHPPAAEASPPQGWLCPFRLGATPRAGGKV